MISGHPTQWESGVSGAARGERGAGRRRFRRWSRIFPIRRRLQCIARMGRRRPSANLRLAWIQARILQGRLGEAERALGDMAARYPVGHPVHRYRAELQAEVLFYQGRYAEFLALLRQFPDETAESRVRPRRVAMHWVVRATSEERRALYREAQTYIEAHPKVMPSLAWALAFIVAEPSVYPETAGLLRRALQKSRVTSDRRTVVETSLALAELYLRGRRLRPARRHARAALREAEAQGLGLFIPACRLLLARLAALDGHFRQACRVHLRAARPRRTEDVGTDLRDAEWMAVRGFVELLGGRAPHRWLDRALREFRAAQDGPWESEVLLVKAVAYAREGRWGAVKRLLPRVPETSGRLLHPSFRPLLFRLLDAVHGRTPAGKSSDEGPLGGSEAGDVEAPAEARLAAVLRECRTPTTPAGHRVPGSEVDEAAGRSRRSEASDRFGPKAVSTRRRSSGMSSRPVPSADVPDIVGTSPAIVEVRRRIVRLADLAVPVLIYGETGTGKELVARALHRLGPHSQEPFIALNCAAIPEHLLESELFGYRQGAFTGADRDTPGLIERAGRGTLFFDEIGDMSLHHQAKVLRVLQERAVRRIGDDIERPARCRFIFATHRDLEEQVRLGKFREDLYFRIRSARIHLPPLRERKADIPRLVEFFMGKYGSTLAAGIRRIHRRTWDCLLKYAWPGNVRELESVLVAAFIEARGDTVLRPEHLPREVREGRPAWTWEDGPAGAESWTIRVAGLQRLGRARREFERQYALRTLAKTGYNKSQASQILGISRATLYHVLRLEAAGSVSPGPEGGDGTDADCPGL